MTLNDLFRMTLDDQSAWQMEGILDGLSKWWLRPEYYEAIRKEAWDRPSLPTERGFCPILLQVKDRNERSICRRGLILPVRWVEKTSPGTERGRSKKLPSALLELAKRVQATLSQEGAEKEADEERKRRWDRLDQWELVPAVERFPDLFALPDEMFSWDSAAIPLAATLLLTAVDEEAPKSDVFGSGAWNFVESHMERIAGVREKRDAVADWGGSILFLPEDGFLDVSFDELQAKSNRPDCPKIKALPSGRRTLRETVDLYRRTLCREPEENDPEKCARYYQQMPNDSAALQDFYRRRLADAVAAKCREKAEERYRDIISRLDKGTLVTWVSTGTELVNVAAKCFHLRKIVLLYWYKKQGKNNRIEPLSTEPELRIKKVKGRSNV